MLAAVIRRASFAILIAFPLVAQAAGTGTVRASGAVNVRERPDLSSAVIVALRRGRVVRVDKVLGDWVLVTLDSGRKGYIKATYLAVAPGAQVAAAAPAETAAPSGRPLATPTATPSSSSSDTPATEQVGSAEPPAGGGDQPGTEGRHEALQDEIARLRDRLTALESAVATPDGTESSDGTPGQGLHERDAARPGGGLLPNAAVPMEPEDIGPSLALAGVGVVVGFLFGSAYGRRQERNRRSRVRF